jgi:hypothetical protein
MVVDPFNIMHSAVHVFLDSKDDMYGNGTTGWQQQIFKKT